MYRRRYAAVEVLFHLRCAGGAGGNKTDESIVECLMRKLNIFSAGGVLGLGFSLPQLTFIILPVLELFLI